jgi:hypothetical protein
VTSQLAFVDESLRPGRYLLGCVAVSAADAGALRRSVRSLLLAGERRLHLQRESKRRRRQILDALTELDLDAAVYVCRMQLERTAEEARSACLARIVDDLQSTDRTCELLIERREGADHRDRATILAQRRPMPVLNFEHLEPHVDPLLWLPDCFARAVGAGGEWSDRVRGTVRSRNVG